jgi:hypothetical protein
MRDIKRQAGNSPIRLRRWASYEFSIGDAMQMLVEGTELRVDHIPRRTLSSLVRNKMVLVSPSGVIAITRKGMLCLASAQSALFDAALLHAGKQLRSPDEDKATSPADNHP